MGDGVLSLCQDAVYGFALLAWADRELSLDASVVADHVFVEFKGVAYLLGSHVLVVLSFPGDA